ncbi:MAG: hypothetical protein JWP96_1160 [Polaromonas sp.]|nr:hypothetical protein [Polaromonas sp.]
MKPLVISLALLSLVVASHAQQLPGAASLSKQIESFQFPSVASPNRVDSATWASSNKFNRNKHPGDKDGASGPPAIVWVDSTGKTIGRALATNSMLVTYENQPAMLTGLESDRSCNAANVCTHQSGGNRWSAFYTVYYLSTDCTGTPYLPYSGFGTPYVGVPVIDGDATYIYILKVTDTTRVNVNSSYVNNTCRSVRGGVFPSDAAPVTAVVPASTFGAAPYFLK